MKLLSRETITRMFVFLLPALIAATCGGSANGSSELLVISTTSILRDVAANVVGDDGVVESLVPLGVDPHDYQASSRQIARLQEADLIVANGLELEEGLQDVLDAAVTDGKTVLYVGPALSPQPFQAEQETRDPTLDPHVWMDPLRMGRAGLLIGRSLEALTEQTVWLDRAESYRHELEKIDSEVMRTLGIVPQSSRMLVTNHETLGYFADRYGFDVAGVVFAGGSTLATPSSAELSGVIRTIDNKQINVIFTDTTHSSDLAAVVAAEAGHPVVLVELWTGSLGPPGSGAETLTGLLTTNALIIAKALQ